MMDEEGETGDSRIERIWEGIWWGWGEGKCGLRGMGEILEMFWVEKDGREMGEIHKKMGEEEDEIGWGENRR